MEQDYQKQIEELIAMASFAKPARNAQPLLQKAISIAQQHKDELLLFESKAQLLLACFRSGHHDRSLALFPSLKQYSEKHPEKVNPEAIMVFYMSIVNGVTEFPNISKKQVESVLKEFEAFYLKNGYSLKEAYRISSHAYLEMGDKNSADKLLKQSANAPSGLSIHQCAACDAYSRITYYDHFGDYETAIRTAEPLLNGKLLCNLKQQVPFAALLLSYINQGNWETAVESYKRAWQLHNTMDYDHLWYVYKFLFFQVLTRNIDQALRSFEKSIEQAANGHAWGLTFLFYLSSRFLFGLLKSEGQATISLQLPSSVPFSNASGVYETGVLLNWLNSEIGRLEKAFNQRNQNLFFSDLRKRHREMEQLVANKQILLND